MTISLTADKLPNMHSTEFRGIPVIIQWPKGSTRVGERKDGTPFKTEMHADYGYIPDTIAAGDEERLDVYIGPDKEADTVYVVEQVRKDSGEFDEYKMMLGFSSLEEAEETYTYQLGDDADVELDDISEIPFDYLFDHVMAERHNDKEQEIEETQTRVEKDEEKIAGDGDKLSVIDAFIKLYKHEMDFYEETAHQTAEILEDALTEAGIRAIVTFRAKKPRKLRAKLQVRDAKRHYQNFRAIYDDIVDLAGVRVALYLPADRDAVGEIIERIFAPVRAPKNFPKDRGPGDGMGYVATHYLVQLRPETLHKDELRYADTNIEIQVASVLMHAWAEVTHDLIYKPDKGALTPAEHKMIDDLNVIVQQGESVLEQLQESVETRNNGAELRFELSAALTKLANQLGLQSKGKARKRITAGDVVNIADRAIKADPKRGSAEWLQALGWRHQGFSDWSHPNQLQEVVQLFPDGWIHRSWDKIVGTGDTLQELKAHLAAVGLGESYLPKQSHYATYLKTKLALWKAHKADQLDDRLRAYNQELKTQLPPTPPGDEVFIYKALEQLHPGTKDVTMLHKDEQQNVIALSQELKRQAQL
jgi:ppGpp synthetase/RelA/SpoT-type nucleotidyltranferase